MVFLKSSCSINPTNKASVCFSYSRDFIINHQGRLNLFMKSKQQPLKQVNTQSPTSFPDHALLRTVFEQAPVAICILDKEFKLQAFNPAAAALFDLTDEDIGTPSDQLQKTFSNATGRNSNTIEKEKNKLRNGGQITAEYDTQNRLGKKLNIYLTVSPFFMDGELKGYNAVLQDVSLMRQLEEENKKKEARLNLLHTLISNTSAPIFIADKNHVVRFWNAGAEDMFSIPGEAALHKKVWDLLTTAETPPDKEKFVHLIETSEKLEKNIVVKSAQGKRITFKLSTTRILDEQNSFDGFLAVCHDITLMRKYEQKLSSLNYSLNQKILEKEHSLFSIDQRLQYHLNNTPLGIIEWEKRRITHWSKRAEEIFGWTAEEAIGKTAEDLNMIYEDDEDVVKLRKQIFGSNTRFERSINRNRTKAGTRLYCEWYSSILRNSKGEISSILAFVQDSTERISAEKELQLKENQLELIYNTISDILFMLDVTPKGFRFAFVNDSFLKVTGLKSEQIIGQYVQDVIPQPSLDMVLANYEKAIAEKRSIQWEEETVYPTGTKTGIVTVTPVCDDSEKCIQLVGSVHDITERKKAEIELEESENRLKTILDTEPECIKLLGHKGEILQMNPAGLAIVEADHISEVVGKHLTHLITEDHRKSFIDLIKNVLEGGSGQLEYQIRGFKGTRRWLETHAVPLRDARHNIIAALSITRDISLQKERDEQLKDLNAQLRQLTDHLEQVREEERISIAREIHDELGQLLTAIKFDLFWAKSNLEKNKEAVSEKLGESLLLIDDTFNTIRRIVSELHPVLLQDLGLVEALRWHVHQFRNKANIDVSFSTNFEEVKLPKKLSLALFRICQEALTNIQRHSKAQKVKIELRKEKNSYRLSIKDDGVGFDTSKQKEHRTFGLLGISERTIMCGGELSIDSALGKGTTILVTLPITTETYE